MANRYNVTSTDQNFEPLANPMTAVGDIIVGGASPAGTPTALAISDTSGDFLASDGTTLGYISQSTSLDNIGGTAGDLLYRGASEWEVLAAGDEGNWLRQGASDTPEWGALQTAGVISSLPAAAATNVGTWYVATDANDALFLQADLGAPTYGNLNVLSAQGASPDEFRTNMVANLNVLSDNTQTTTNDTPAECGNIAIPSGSQVAVQVLVKGVKDDLMQIAAFTVTGAAKNVAGTVTIVGSPVRGGTAQSDVGSTWNATLIPSATPGALGVQVTGQTATNIAWTATLVLIA
jgi:hypothetical protein